MTRATSGSLSPKWGTALDTHIKRVETSNRRLADLLGSYGFDIHHSTVGRWRKGVVPKQGIGIIPILAAYFDCPVSDFVEDAYTGQVTA